MERNDSLCQNQETMILLQKMKGRPPVMNFADAVVSIDEMKDYMEQ